MVYHGDFNNSLTKALHFCSFQVGRYRNVLLVVFLVLYIRVTFHKDARSKSCSAPLGNYVPILPTGFDRNATLIFEHTLQNMQMRVFKNNIVQVAMEPVTWKAVSNGFWKYVNEKRWETDIFQYILQYANRETFFVDLGTWIGPTIMYAGQMTRKAIGIEGDPAAYAELVMNLNINYDKFSNVFVQPACVSYENGKRQMRSAKAGNSCSGLGRVSCGEVKETWNVQCYDLRDLLRVWYVPIGLNTVIKIDIEGFECDLLSNMAHWIVGRLFKPTLLVSLHGETNGHCSVKQYKLIHELTLAYRYSSCKHSEGDFDDFVRQCSSGNLVLSDYMEPLNITTIDNPDT